MAQINILATGKLGVNRIRVVHIAPSHEDSQKGRTEQLAVEAYDLTNPDRVEVLFHAEGDDVVRLVGSRLELRK